LLGLKYTSYREASLEAVFLINCQSPKRVMLISIYKYIIVIGINTIQAE